MADRAHVERITLTVANFLKPFLPLANLHNCEFLTNQLWHQALPEHVQLQLDDIEEEQLIQLLLGDNDVSDNDVRDNDVAENDMAKGDFKDSGVAKDVTNSLTKDITQSGKPDVSNNRTNNVTTGAPNNAAVNDMEHCLQVTKSPDATDIKEDTDKHDTIRPEWDRNLRPTWGSHDLRSFVTAARQHTLPHLDVVTSLDDVMDISRYGKVWKYRIKSIISPWIIN